LKLNVVAWAVGTVLLTTLWIGVEWNANGAFERFAHEGNAGDWNPTLWALAIGVWSLVVGVMALRVFVERPVTAAEIDRAVTHFEPRFVAEHPTSELRACARRRLEGVRRLKFHAAAWALGIVVITPINVLIEWQDNGAFERFSGDSQPGSWDPWVLAIAGIWALAIVILALFVYLDRPGTSPGGRTMRRPGRSR